MYVVSIIPQEMAWEVAHPAVLLCGSRRHQLNKRTKPPYKTKRHEYPHEAGFHWMTHIFEANLWIATGYTRSQFHYDKEWNVNCLLSGTKRWIFLDPPLGSLRHCEDILGACGWWVYWEAKQASMCRSKGWFREVYNLRHTVVWSRKSKLFLTVVSANALQQGFLQGQERLS